ncbi:hypothetical protein J437_LFUL015654 [Ladona fulva]|uniref:ETS domain-containing protein n=1 Tax=Ladona fulva TaxID=123851 RepID=A0A8K0KQW7_LADFU|nr:hypothetical protein J437_LFUL015654 [Ladona fulva]
MTKVHGKRYAYKFDFHGLMQACQAQAAGAAAEGYKAYAAPPPDQLGIFSPSAYSSGKLTPLLPPPPHHEATSSQSPSIFAPYWTPLYAVAPPDSAPQRLPDPPPP